MKNRLFLSLVTLLALMSSAPVCAQESDYDDVSDNPFMFRLFMPATLYRSVIDRATGLQPTALESDATVPADTSLLPISEFRSLSDSTNLIVDKALLKLYLDRPELVRQTESELKEVRLVKPVTENLASGIAISDTRVNTIMPTDDKKQETQVYKTRHWKTFGNFQGKYTQTYFSENWYKGGSSNHSVLASTVLEANYANEGTTLDNKLEMKLGFISTGTGEERDVRTNDDLLRLTTKFGLKAHNNWYYSAQLQSYTQFLPVFDQKVPTKLKSKFLAPAYSNLSIGMDYKPKFKKNTTTLSLQISPFSYNYRYVSVDSIVTNYGIEKGKNHLLSMGCKVECNFKYTFFKDFTLNSKFQYYSTFKSVEINFENTLDYKLSKYFSLQFFTHWRFDDSVKKPHEDWGYHQFKELLTLNFNYAW